MTRRALLAAGAALAAAGCGRDQPPARPAPAVEALQRQLAAERATLAAYRGWGGRDVRRIAARVRAHVARLEAAVRAAGGRPAATAPAPPGRPGPRLARERELAALGVHVEALPSLTGTQRRLGGDLVVDAAQHAAALAPMLGQSPDPTPFPGDAAPAARGPA